MLSLEQESQKDISKEILQYIGGIKNIKTLKHCSSRLRLTVRNRKKVSLHRIKRLKNVKAAYLVENKLQIIFGEQETEKIYNGLSQYIKDNYNIDVNEKFNRSKPNNSLTLSLCETFEEILPYVLLGAILLGLTNLFSKTDFVKGNLILNGINFLIKLASVWILMVVPMMVCFITTKNYGGRPILGLIIGSLMLDTTLLAKYEIGKIGVNPQMMELGINSQYAGFQGNIIVAFLMGILVAYIDRTLGKRKSRFVKNFISPVVTLIITTLLLFGVIGKIIIYLENSINLMLFWATQNLGMAGYGIFAGSYELVRILGLHHIIDAAQATLVNLSGRNFIGALVYASLISQAGALAGYMLVNLKNAKARAVSIPGIISILLGIPEPVLFGVNLKHRYTIVTGSIGAAFAGAYVYKKNIAFVDQGLSSTTIKGDFMIAGIIGFIIGMILTIVIVNINRKKTRARRRTIKNISVEETLKDQAVKNAINETLTNNMKEEESNPPKEVQEKLEIKDEFKLKDESFKEEKIPEIHLDDKISDLQQEYVKENSMDLPELEPLDVKDEEFKIEDVLTQEEKDELAMESDAQEEKVKNETLETYLSTLKKNTKKEEDTPVKHPSEIQEQTEKNLQEDEETEKIEEKSQEIVEEETPQEVIEEETPQEYIEQEDIEDNNDDIEETIDDEEHYKNGVSQGAFLLEPETTSTHNHDISKTRLYNREEFLNQINNNEKEEFEEIKLDSEINAQEEEKIQEDITKAPQNVVPLIEEEELHPNIDKTNLVTKEEMYDLYSIYGNQAKATLEESCTIRPSIVRLISPMEGVVRDVKECSDPAFASEKMGKGIVIIPQTGVVIAPANGRVEFIFPSHHAIGLSFEDGSRMLIHCGINTVNLNGKGFEVYVREKEKINQGQRLMAMDINFVKSEGYSIESVAVISEPAPNTNVTVTPAKQIVMSIK